MNPSEKTRKILYMPRDFLHIPGMALKKIGILGSTGSIGTHTLDVVGEHPDRFEITGLAAGKNIA